MSWQVTTTDRTTLPEALLPAVKAHCRIDFADDDAILKTYTSVAIAQLERVWGLQVFAQEGQWSPPGAPAGKPALNCWPTPVTPFSDFTAVDADGNDTTAAFQSLNMGSTESQNYIRTSNDLPFPAGNVFTLKAGFASLDDLPPEALGVILQVTARLYEYRENVQSFGVNLMPLWLNDLLVGLWQPRA